MACVNQTRPHYGNQMGKTQSNDLTERHGRGTAWEQHGNGMVCVNPPLKVKVAYVIPPAKLLRVQSLRSYCDNTGKNGPIREP
jgi:hypothetical protein